MTTKNAAVGVAKRRNKKVEAGVLTLSTGIEARLLPVSISIINEAQAAIADPEVPQWYNEAKDRHEPNPDHPQYAIDQKKAEEQRNLAAIDAMIMFGVELVGDECEDGGWVKKLQLRSKMGLTAVDFAQWDLDDPTEREFVFKKYIAVGSQDTVTLMKFSGVSEEDIAEAGRSFPDNEGGAADTSS